MNRTLHSLFYISVAILPSRSTCIYGEGSESSFFGRVLDPSSSAIVGAHITIIPIGRVAGKSTVSDDNGQFTLPLEPGRYTVKISAKDFLEVTEAIEIGNAPESRDF